MKPKQFLHIIVMVQQQERDDLHSRRLGLVDALPKVGKAFAVVQVMSLEACQPLYLAIWSKAIHRKRLKVVPYHNMCLPSKPMATISNYIVSGQETPPREK
jgi:hypothetical protein